VKPARSKIFSRRLKLEIPGTRIAESCLSMNSLQSNRRAGAFSLVELLTVIAIIAILAALLLPVLSRTQMRAQRALCGNDLGQMGIAFHLFMHDHDGKFPMQVPMSAGGSQEFVQNGYAVGGEFYFSYRHFQVLSNELVAPKILVCPADTRPPAVSFSALKNDNVSYFVGVDADFGKPNSILAGDRNIVDVPLPNPSIVHGGTGYQLRWTKELHQFKGNVLFADGHVEEWNNSMVAASANNSGATADFFLPAIQQSPARPAYATAGPTFGATHDSSPSSGSSGTMPGNNNPSTGTQSAPPVNPPNQSSSVAYNDQMIPRQIQNGRVETQDSSNAVRTILMVTNLPVVAPTQDETNVMSTFDKHVVKTLGPILKWSYLLLLLLLLLLLAFELWRRRRQRKNRKARLKR
jgi:prepilin-type processing-associated H-X9-DG protein/prepilin-type N-terminal cleavage/methylation domain-containing protein